MSGRLRQSGKKIGKYSMKQKAELKRAIGLIPLVLYGLGVTIGAGIYVLVGETAARAGYYAPASFLLAAFVMSFSAASFAEFSSRIPQSAGEAAFVEAAFSRNWLTLLTGGAIILSGIVAAAAISLGCAGYLSLLVEFPDHVLVPMIVCTMGLMAAWGIRESVTFAGILTVLEIAGLLGIIVAGFGNNPSLLIRIPEAFPPLDDHTALSAIFSASLIAFFAFVGFDDVINIVEETIDPARIMPWAIGITLAAVTVLYCLVSIVALDALPLEELSASRAPIGLMFERLTGFSPIAITLIAIFATLNGVVIQIIMASRVAYGLARKGYLPASVGQVHPVTRTPLVGTALITGAVLVLAFFVRLDQLAQWTSQIILSVFLLVNLALIRVKLRGDPVPREIFQVPVIVPILGALTCFLLLVAPLFVE
jgi:amino acid transporter